MRVILYTGKGGVGKTSVAAATALRAAQMGHRTVIMSTDMAHSLADSFDMPLDSAPVAIAENLWGHEIDVYREMDRYWGTVKEWLTALMHWQGMDEIVADEMAVLPGMEELVGLLYITQFFDDQGYDLLIVDCAPTGETLRLLSFPETARWYMRRLFPIERRVASAIGPLARTFLNLPVPDDKVFNTVQDLFGQLERMKAILSDSQTSSVRLVVNAEKMVIKEAQRTFTYLNLYGYHTDLVVCNRLIPQEVGDNFFDSWKESQGRYLRLIQEGFSPIPILGAPLMDHEVVGQESLSEMGEAIFGQEDPTKIFYNGRLQKITQEGKRHVLRILLPFVTREEIALLRNGDELVVQAGKHRRTVVLPRTLTGLEVREAVMDGDTLRLEFESPKPLTQGAPKSSSKI